MRYKLNQKINFGQYKDEGLTIREIIDDHPDYIDWAIENIEWFELDNEAFDYFEKRSSKDDFEYGPYFDEYDYKG